MKAFQIPTPTKATNKAIRFPNDVIDSVKNAITGTDCTFTAFVVEAVKFALENLEDEEAEI